MKPESNRPITIEGLLRLKRAERPPTEFWVRFDRELRAKQLSALMARRPWWQRLPSVWPVLIRHRVLLGASAVLAVTLISVRNTRAPLALEQVLPPANSVVDPGMAKTTVASGLVENDFVASERIVARPPLEQDLAMVASTPVAVADPAGLNGGASRITPMPGASGPALASEMQGGSARFVTTALAATVVGEKLNARKAAKELSFDARVLPTRGAVEPLQQMTPPGETRRARLLTAMVATASLEASARATERVASRIDEERLYDQIRRFGASGDRLHVKF